VGVVGFAVVPDAALRASEGRIDLEPEARGDDAPFARSAMSYGPADVFFSDDQVFLEDAGFWIRGEQTASVAIAAAEHRGGPPPVLRMVLRNGAVPNVVQVDTDVTLIDATDRHHWARELAPSEEHTIDLPTPTLGHAVRVRIHSSSGFRPSDVGRSADSRYLGVWVEIR
jgi:hypothetical protein